MIIRQRQAGFTLLELVVGIAILALITTLLVNVLGTGIAATAQLDRRTERIELAHHVHRLLRERLEIVRPQGWEKEGRRLPVFIGEAGGIRFITTRPPWPETCSSASTRRRPPSGPRRFPTAPARRTGARRR